MRGIPHVLETSTSELKRAIPYLLTKIPQRNKSSEAVNRLVAVRGQGEGD